MNVREMYNYGYKWTGMIPLTAEEARNLFLNGENLRVHKNIWRITDKWKRNYMESCLQSLNMWRLF